MLCLAMKPQFTRRLSSDTTGKDKEQEYVPVERTSPSVVFTDSRVGRSR
jgi:hypothetical protein